MSNFLTPSYSKLIKNLDSAWDKLSRPALTLSEKLLHSHLSAPLTSIPVRGATYLKLKPDRVAMQDASAQTALLQFMLSKKRTAFVPTSVHCDHLIQASMGADKDLDSALGSNKEVFDFLQSCSRKYGVDFWPPGSGIIHQIVLENYAAPGLLMLGTDSHTPNGGGLGMLSIGVGGADAVDAMSGLSWELKAPKVLGVKLIGKLQNWSTPKDVVLALVGRLTVQGATNHIIEYFGPGVDTLSCTGMATVCNMGAEMGATTSVFPYTDSMRRYLIATQRPETAKKAAEAQESGFLNADEGAHYDQIIEIDLSLVEPRINGPFSPDISWSLSEFKAQVKEQKWPASLSSALIGSCTNSSYQDMSNVAQIARQATLKGVKAKTEFLITPGSEQIRATVERDGFIDDLETIGGTVLANACGPCIGQWKRDPSAKKEQNAILTSFNRNFKGRNDGSSSTLNFLASPEIVTAMALSGDMTFNPITDSLIGSDGKPFKLSPPVSSDLPSKGFLKGRDTLAAPIASNGHEEVEIKINKNSDRLQELQPFAKWNGLEFRDLAILAKTGGKCTTDHISAAGPWLKYKGHLENISKNTLIGALNVFTGKVNTAKNQDSLVEDTIPNTAEAYLKNGKAWVIIADDNYGEGSAREHAAMQPRFLGCKVVIARSFARIHGIATPNDRN